MERWKFTKIMKNNVPNIEEMTVRARYMLEKLHNRQDKMKKIMEKIHDESYRISMDIRETEEILDELEERLERERILPLVMEILYSGNVKVSGYILEICERYEAGAAVLPFEKIDLLDVLRKNFSYVN